MTPRSSPKAEAGADSIESPQHIIQIVDGDPTGGPVDLWSDLEIVPTEQITLFIVAALSSIQDCADCSSLYGRYTR